MKTIEHRYRDGKWSEDEHLRFLKALQNFGRNWRAISRQVITRSAIQIRSHAQKYFLKTEKLKIQYNWTKTFPFASATTKDAATQYGEDVKFCN